MAKTKSDETALNIIKLKPSEMLQVLRIAIQERKPALVVGPPGCGKTAICREATQLEGGDAMLAHPVMEDPTYARGFPDLGGEYARFKLYGHVAKMVNAKKLTVVTLEDFGQAPGSVQSGYMPWLLDGICGEYRINREFVTFLASTNRRTDKSGVSGIFEAVKSRFTGGIYHWRTDKNEFVEIMFKLGFHPSVISFLRAKPDLINSFDPTNDIVSYPCERTWEAVSDSVKRGLVPLSLEHAVYGGKAGVGAAGEFIAHLRTYRELEDPEVVLANPTNAKIPEEESALFALVTGLAYHTTTDNFSAIFKYAMRLYDVKPSSRVEFASLLLEDSYRHCREVLETKTFKVDLKKHELGKFMIQANKAT